MIDSDQMVDLTHNGSTTRNRKIQSIMPDTIFESEYIYIYS